MSTRSRIGSVLAAAAITAVCGSARADEADTIAWEAPAACPGADALRAQVAGHLGRDLADDEVTARVVITRHGKRWRMALTMADGERGLEAASCDDLVASAALIVAMALAPQDEAGDGTGEDASAGTEDSDLARDLAAVDDEAPPAAVPSLRRRQIDTSVREPRPPVDIDVRVRAAVGGELGTLPDPASGVGGGVEVSFDAWSADLAVHHWREQRGFVAGPTGPGADASLTTVVARACYAGVDRRLRFGGCLGAELDAMRSQGFDFDVVYPAQTTLGAGLHVGVLWAVQLAGPLAVRADIGAAMLLARPVLTEDMDGAIIHDPNFLTWRGLVGAEVTFP